MNYTRIILAAFIIPIVLFCLFFFVVPNMFTAMDNIENAINDHFKSVQTAGITPI